MHIALAALCFAASLAVAVSTTYPGRHTVPAVLASFAAPASALLLPPEHTFLRFLFMALGLVVIMRVLDLRRDPTHWPTRMRLWIFVGLVDVRAARRVAPSVDRRAFGAVALHFGIAVFGWWLAHRGGLLVRWGGGLLLIYGAAYAALALPEPLYRMAGWQIPKQHDAPIAATSVSAFWSRHHNINVSAWLDRHVHRPCVRRGRPLLGVVLAFGASALAHASITLVALDMAMAATMCAFFCVQIVPIALERVCPRLRRAPDALRRAWTIAWLVLPAPLFVEPFLRILEG